RGSPPPWSGPGRPAAPRRSPSRRRWPRWHGPSPRSNGISRCPPPAGSGTPAPRSPAACPLRPHLSSWSSWILQESGGSPSPASHEVHQLERVSRTHLRGIVTSAVQDLAVVLDHDQTGVQPQIGEQPRDGAPGGDLPRLAVECDLDRRLCHIVPSSNTARYRRAASAGSAAFQTPPSTATPYAPASNTAPARSGVIPPIATIGARAPCTVARTRSGPAPGSPGCDVVGKIVPSNTKFAPARSASSTSAAEWAE